MLTDAEYREIIKCRNALRGQIEAKQREYDELGELRDRVGEIGDVLKEQRELYTNFLSDDLDEYESQHPPEES